MKSLSPDNSKLNTIKVAGCGPCSNLVNARIRNLFLERSEICYTKDVFKINGRKGSHYGCVCTSTVLYCTEISAGKISRNQAQRPVSPYPAIRSLRRPGYINISTKRIQHSLGRLHRGEVPTNQPPIHTNSDRILKTNSALQGCGSRPPATGFILILEYSISRGWIPVGALG